MVKEERITVGGVYGMGQCYLILQTNTAVEGWDDEELEGGKGFI